MRPNGTSAVSFLAVLAFGTCGSVPAPADPPTHEFAFVPGEHAQPSGTTYDFRTTRYEVRNDRFVVFLNDALANPDDPRGYYMYFDLDSGNVHVNYGQQGSSGNGGNGGAKMFDAGVNPDISYDPDLQEYVVCDDPPRADHPVTGVTWFGAVKYCNWLTVSTGLAPDQRAYAEAAADSLDGWHPVTITTEEWITRDLDTAERLDLVSNYTGYRLAMDQGEPQASPYNEWYKAAAWHNDDGVNHVYGFGRDELTPADANYLGSEDPFESFERKSTPVGFYDGTLHNPGGNGEIGDGREFPTNPDRNGYGLFDASGNVWEWMQDQSPSNAAVRRLRSGSWANGTFFMQLIRGVFNGGPDEALNNRGFRVVQCVRDGFLATPAEYALSGPWGGPFDQPLPLEFTIENVDTGPGAPTMVFEVTTEAPWIADPIIDPPPIGPGESAMFEVHLNLLCVNQGLKIGEENVASINITRIEPQIETSRNVVLTITEPLQLQPPDDFEATMLFASRTDPPQKTYVLDSESETAVDWDATVEPPAPESAWLEVAPTAGTLDPFGNIDVVFAIDPAESELLPPGEYDATVTLTDVCTGTEFTRDASLTISDPFSIDLPQGIAFTGLLGGPFEPPGQQAFRITSETDVAVTWRAQFDPEPPPWLDVPVTSGVIEAFEYEDVYLGPSPEATQAPVGLDEAAVKFATGPEFPQFELERTVTLEVVDFVKEPEDRRSSGPLGGPFDPDSFTYTLQNAEPFPDVIIDVKTDAPWLDILGGPTFYLSRAQPTAEVEFALNETANSLDAGEHEAKITFTRPDVEPQPVTSERTITLLVGSEAFSIPMSCVPADHLQPNGPRHFFRIGVTEVTNSQFVRFLNDARDNQGNARGQYMDFDLQNGVVYLGEGLRTTKLFDAQVGARIRFERDRFRVEDDYENHPTVGVSWYGAAKFCNWLTVVQKMSLDERVYNEGPLVDDWFPLADGNDLITTYSGFRMATDGGVGGADLYNEWYKAAAWDDDAQPPGNHVYGFGRDEIVNADANFLHSGDPFSEGATPVGFYDGTLHNPGGNGPVGDGREFQTNADANGYSLFDMCGNVAEWTHTGRGGVERGLRGGHYLNADNDDSLKNATRDFEDADATLTYIGFRAAQSFVETPSVLVEPPNLIRINGYAGGPFDPVDPNGLVFDLTNPGSATLDDLEINIDAAWLEIDGFTPRQIPPGDPVELALKPAESAADLQIEPPPGGMSPAWLDENQPLGPQHNFWTSQTETTNGDFIVFLNNAVENLENERGFYLFFDEDTGHVFINNEEKGEVGPDGDGTLIFDPEVAGKISFDSQELEYHVEQGYEDHPVVGVTWFGAVKYCNWRTIADGLPVVMRAYTEGPTPQAWHPVTITEQDWRTRDLDEPERLALISNSAGYRLPMDQGEMRAATYGEWYKAAAWDDVNQINHDYGFGRDLGDMITGADANYLDSGDPFDNGTTPVGYYDGSDHGGFLTNADENFYDLRDVSGNVWEWMQDQSVSDPKERRLRGGSWNDPSALMELVQAVADAGPDLASHTRGIRLVRSPGRVATITITNNITGQDVRSHVILEVMEPFHLDPPSGLGKTARYGGDLRSRLGNLGSYVLTNRSATQMQWSVHTDKNWFVVTERVSGEPQGVIEPDGQLTFDVDADQTVNNLPPGDHDATITFRNDTSGGSLTRPVRLSITSPIEVTPDENAEFSGLWGGPFNESKTYTLTRVQQPEQFNLDYEVSADRDWVTIEPHEHLTGPLEQGANLEFRFGIDNELAGDLDIGEHRATLSFSFIDRDNGDLRYTIERTLILAVEDPLLITQDEEPWEEFLPPPGEPLPEQDYTLTNRYAGEAVSVTIEAEFQAQVEWLTIVPEHVIVPKDGGMEQVTVSINENARLLESGLHQATLKFTHRLIGQDVVQMRTVMLTVEENLAVRPFRGFAAAGRPGGPIAPVARVYKISNIPDGRGDIEWRVAIVLQNPEYEWLHVGSGSPTGGTLGDGDELRVRFVIDTDITTNMPPGDYQATVEFIDVTNNDETTRRDVTLTLFEPLLAVDQSWVAAKVVQPGGPVHSFSTARFHTTNVEFVTFLNNALDNLNNERGHYMFFDADTGKVYIHHSRNGEIGPGQSGTPMFDPSVGRYIEWDGVRYSAVEGFEDHPVVGVSWFGAVKYCNWLTIDQSMQADQRCYTEAPQSDLAGWHPVTIDYEAWKLRDLNDVERKDLIENYAGYRLPMDGGEGAGDPSLYNEWYKSAGWNASLDKNTRYGFGRDNLEDADANFPDSGDPFEPFDPPTTPVGFYDGTLYNPGGNGPVGDGREFQTNPNDNTFDVYDQSGNAFQWMQDRYCGRCGTRHAIRGGSHGVELDITQRLDFDGVYVTDDVGFRVVRVRPADGDADLDGDVDLDDLWILVEYLTGPDTGNTVQCPALDFDADDDIDLDDAAAFQNVFDPDP